MFDKNKLISFIENSKSLQPLLFISEKVLNGERISVDQAILLYEVADLGYLSMLANHVREAKNGNHVYFNKNFHVEPTNTCIYNCKFCSYHKIAGDPESWEMSLNEIAKLSENYQNKDITEVHVVGGVHPKWDIHYYGKIIQSIKIALPHVHVKAFSAIELEYVIKKANLDYREGLRTLKEYGLDSIPGGGAEIFDPQVRDKICSDKATGKQWLDVHEAAHLEGIPSNATILYGHIESYKHRAQHMEAIRNLQDKTGGFNCFIPLKFRAQNNNLGYLGEVETVEDLRNFAVSRIFFDNINHLKAYWPMLGKQNTKLALSFGVDDIDGTIDDTTKIYSMAGAEDQKPAMTVDKLCEIIKSAGRTPVERDSLYNVVKFY
ncbi:MAG: aminofutalosine synthase MqnE [Bacteroidales bacterium]|nr:MAG: aminofutalosine synthase MqnE [Bacteroidales bacterium]